MNEQQDDDGIAKGESAYAADRTTVNRWRESARYYNQWRRDSVKAIEYFDGNQFDYELKQKYLERGLPLLYENCIRRWVSTVVGQQANQQTDGVVTVEDNRYEQFGEALSARLKEAERLSMADKACLVAFDTAIKAGLGWVEVGDPNDPFDYPHRVESLPWREIWWDMSDRNPNLMQAEWFRRVKYHRRNEIMEAFPDAKDLILTAGNDNDPLTWAEQERYERQELYQRDPSQWSTWGTYDRDQLCLNEIRYRVWVNGYIMQTPGGQQVFDEKNPEHMQAYQQGLVNPQPARYRKARQSFWIGPHRLLDRWLNVPNGEIGWVPFFCHIEERTGVPYGLIRDMIPLQDEINTRKAKAAWSIDAHTIITDHDKVLNLDDARTAVNKRNGIIILDGNKAGGRFEIDRHPGTSSQNIQLYESAKSTIGYIHGLDAPFAGTPSTPGQSGVAQQTLIQQSVAALGMPLDNYRMSRKRVLGLLLDRLIAEIGGQPTELRYKHSNGAHKSVMVNVPIQMPDGSVEVLTPGAIKKNLVLEETPSTATYRQYQNLALADAIRSMPPELQKYLVPIWLETSDLPNRQARADQLRKDTGMGEPMNDQENQAMQAQQQKQEAQEELAMRGVQAKVALDEAKVAEIQAKTQEAQAKAQQDMQKMQTMLSEIMAKISNTQADTAKTVAETKAIEQDMHDQAVVLSEQPIPQKTQVVYRW